MAYELFWGAGSSYSWRVLLGLEVKGLEYQSRLLEFSKNEHQSPEMLAMNPRGRVPVLKDGDYSIYESIAILAYLDKKHPETPLFGSTATETGLIWQRLFEIENYISEPIMGLVRPIFFDDVGDSIDAIEKSASYAYAEFKTLETIFKQSNFLAGDKISAADIALFPLIQSLLRALTFKNAQALNLNFIPLEKNYSGIANWIKRIEAIPGYNKTYPPNWKD